jgi:hypothetical protein
VILLKSRLKALALWPIRSRPSDISPIFGFHQKYFQIFDWVYLLAKQKKCADYRFNKI